MPTAEIEVLEVRKGYVLTEQTALHLRAVRDFTDLYGKKRKAGEEWLIDNSVKDVHIVDAHEELVAEKRIIVLTQNQFCIVRNPITKESKGKPEFGKQQVRRGDVRFFLQPGEELYDGIKNIMVIQEDEALLVRATVPYFDKRTNKAYKAG
jgi:major vault protein